MDPFRGTDYGVYSFFHANAPQVPWLRPFMEAGYYLGAYGWLGFIAGLAAFAYVWPGRRREMITLLVWMAVGLILLEVCVRVVRRPPPESAVRWFGTAAFDAFPARSVGFFTLVLVMFVGWFMPIVTSRLVRLSWIVLAVVLVVWVMVSSLFLGLHHFTDTLAGVSGGAALGLYGLDFTRRGK